MITFSQHLVRVGVMGQIGRYRASDAARYPRGTRVICRTDRGLEVGEVLAHPTALVADAVDGTLLRPMTAEDELLLARLKQRQPEAVDACCRLLAQRGVTVPLLEVEQLFDGRAIYFYFLGEVPPEGESLIEELAETYEAKVRFREFAQAVETGCGPGCGTETARGCGDACVGCAVAVACQNRGPN